MEEQIKLKNISIDQVQRLYRQAILGIYATILNSAIVTVLLITVVPKPKIVFWFCTMLIVSLVRIFTQRHLGKSEISPENIRKHKNFFFISLTLSSCLWGLTGIFLFPLSSLAHQVLLVFVLGGMVAGTVGVYASIMTAFYCFSIPALLPITAHFIIIGDGIHYGMGAMTVLFWFFMFTTARRLNGEILTFLNLKYKNIDLISDLENEIQQRKTAQENLLTRNQQIETIVSDRTTELRQVNKKLLEEIDDRIEAENALRESEKKFREFANSLPQIVFETDILGSITFANHNALESLGYAKADLKNGLDAFQVIAPESRPRAREKFQAVLSGERSEGVEYTALRRDGTRFPIAIHSTVVMRDNKPAGIRGIIIDLTASKRVEEEQRQLESQLQRAQKMEVLGTMAGGVAHDLNNILSGIVSYPDLLLMQIPRDSSLRPAIQTIKESGIKAAVIVQDLLTLTRRGVVSEDVLNLNDIITEYLQSPEHQKIMAFHHDIHINQALQMDLLNILGSRVHLAKTVMNLVSNAAEAIPDGGEITISTSNRYLDHPLRRYDDIEEGDYVVLNVSDTGIGIAPADVERIFEPFFTKKVMGRSGTGLGMAVVWGTVKDHKGYIDVDSMEDKGTTFSLYFPVTRKIDRSSDTTNAIASDQGNGELVLVVDDVHEQRKISSEMLTLLGYRVATVPSGEEAIEWLSQKPADMVLLDMIMAPGMNGLDTYRKIIELRPKQKTVIASGFSETDRVKQAQGLGAGPYLKKPYTLSQLRETVYAVLNGN